MGTRFGKALLVGVAALVGTAAGAVVTRVGVVGATVAPAVGSVVVTVTPTRILDTRSSDGGPIGGPAGPLGAGASRDVKAAGVNPVPADAVGVVLNITAVNATASSFITVWPTGGTRPNASTLNPAQGQTRFNSATVLLGAAGSFSIYHSAGSVDVLVDVVGYLVATTTTTGTTRRRRAMRATYRPTRCSTSTPRATRRSPARCCPAPAAASSWPTPPRWRSRCRYRLVPGSARSR